MNKEKLVELHRNISECTYNLESASREWQKYHVAAGVKSPSQILIEASRNRIHDLIDEAFSSEAPKETCVKCGADRPLSIGGECEDCINDKLGKPKKVCTHPQTAITNVCASDGICYKCEYWKVKSI